MTYSTDFRGWQPVQVVKAFYSIAILAQRYYDEQEALADERIVILAGEVNPYYKQIQWSGKCIFLLTTKLLESKTKYTKDRTQCVLLLEDSENAMPLGRELIIW